jgi:hypothetical protein
MKRIVIVGVGLAVVALAATVARQGQAQGPPYPGPNYPGGPGQPGVPGVGGQGMPALGGGPPGLQNFSPTSPPLVDRKSIDRQANSRILAEWREPQEDPDMNRDLLVTDKAGGGLIFIYSYEEAHGPSLARAMAMELRQNYGLAAFIWNYGDDERKAELERVRQETERRRQALRQAGLSADVPIRVPHMKIRVQCAVLIGGYRDLDAARRDLDHIKKLRPLDPVRFKFPEMFIIPPAVGGHAPPGERAALNPFLKAFAVRNPALGKNGQPVDRDTLDLALLQRLNSDESYSLLNCRKPWTLAVKQFQLPTVVESRSSPPGFLQKIGLGGSNSAKDTAKSNAHELARLLREGGWESYVLHTRFASIVTVRGYDGKDDPRLIEDQKELAKVNSRMARMPGLNMQLFPQAMPMEVPR